MLCPACDVILYERVALMMLRNGVMSICALSMESTPSLIAMYRTLWLGKNTSIYVPVSR